MTPPLFFTRFRKWAHQRQLGRTLLIFLVGGSVLCVIATYIMLTTPQPFLKNNNVFVILFCLDFALLLMLAAIIAKHTTALWAERKSDQAGAKLQSRMVAIFSFLAIAPTILVAGFSAIFFNIVVQSWFNKRVETAISESIEIAAAYLDEHKKVITANAQAMAAGLSPILMNSDAAYTILQPDQEEKLGDILTSQTQPLSLDEAILFNSDMQVLARSVRSFSLDFAKIPLSALSRASITPLTYTDENSDRVRALVAIPLDDHSYNKIYLLVGRQVSPTVLNRIEHAQKAAEEYARLESEGSDVALRFAAIFVGLAIILLSAAVLGGILFANKLARPMRRLIKGSQEIAKGNFSARIPEDESAGEFSSLISSYNSMTTQLESQREQINRRRRFTEAVLGGVSAGVIGLDSEGRIHLPNQSASNLLGIDLTAAMHQKLTDVVPEMGPLFSAINTTASPFVEKQITVTRGGHSHTFLMRLFLDKKHNSLNGYVVTFDDITQLQSAQRKAAWSDVARRIAHEIKNPLTPIRLSAERLQKRYSQQITQDPETFQNCIHTIIRQVDHIGKLATEFSSFARMPSPNIKQEDLVEICAQELFLQQQAHSDMELELKTTVKKLPFECDRGQIGQAITNLIQNATQAIGARSGATGRIELSLTLENNKIILALSDNGIGLPPEGRERLTEPYITFREKGTGLGLAIVKKIVEDHGGVLSLQDRPEGGAVVYIVFLQSKETLA